jgi:hypothetical protein
VKTAIIITVSGAKVDKIIGIKDIALSEGRADASKFICKYE